MRAACSRSSCAFPSTRLCYHWYYELWGGVAVVQPRRRDVLDRFVRMYVLLPLVLFGPPTVLMGLSFPILQRAVQDDPATSGWKAGVLQAANIAGCVAGSLVVGLVTLTLVGTPGTMRLLLLVGLVFAGLGLAAYGRRSVFVPSGRSPRPGRARPPRAARPSGCGCTGRPRRPRCSTRTRPASPRSSRRKERLWQVWSGGRTHSSLPFGGIHTTLGAAPAIIHPAPRAVAIVGLGSGDTAASAGCRRDVEQRITVFEIFAPQRRLLGRLMSRAGSAGTTGPLPGRPALHDPRSPTAATPSTATAPRYDLIEADALWPTSPYAGNLYSLEFFALCARRLNPGGMVTTWAPTDRVTASFLRRPALRDRGGGRRASSSAAVARSPSTREEWQRRLYDAAIVRLPGPAARGTASGPTSRERRAPPSPPGRAMNHDLFPRDEFHSPD